MTKLDAEMLACLPTYSDDSFRQERGGDQFAMIVHGNRKINSMAGIIFVLVKCYEQ